MKDKDRVISELLGIGVTGSNTHESEFSSLLPIAIKAVAKTIASELVSASPMMDPPRWDPLEVLEIARKRYRDYPTQDHRERLTTAIKDAIPGLSESSISEAIEFPEKLNDLIRIQKLGNKFGI